MYLKNQYTCITIYLVWVLDRGDDKLTYFFFAKIWKKVVYHERQKWKYHNCT